MKNAFATGRQLAKTTRKREVLLMVNGEDESAYGNQTCIAIKTEICQKWTLQSTFLFTKRLFCLLDHDQDLDGAPVTWLLSRYSTRVFFVEVRTVVTSFMRDRDCGRGRLCRLVQ